MANDIIRPVELPPRANPVASEIVPSDNGSVVGGVTWTDGVNAGRPLANQVEAEAGVNATKSMTPLTTKQAIGAQVPGLISTAINGLNLGTASQQPVEAFATAAQGVKADTAVQPGDLADVATSGDAADVSYNGASSGLSATNAQSAIDELAGENLRDAESVAVAELANIPASVNYVRTAGYAAAGDGGGALYKRVLTEPDHPGKFQSADGAWWDLVEDVQRPASYGAVPADIGSASGNASALRFAIDRCIEDGSGAIEIPAKTWFLDSQIVVDYSDTFANILLKGNGSRASILRWTGNSAGLKIKANGTVRVEDLTLMTDVATTEAALALEFVDGYPAYQISRIVATGQHLMGGPSCWHRGIEIIGGGGNSHIRECVIFGNGNDLNSMEFGIYITTPPGSLQHSTQHRIIENLVTAATYGLRVDGGAIEGLHATRNDFVSVVNGIWIDFFGSSYRHPHFNLCENHVDLQAAGGSAIFMRRAAHSFIERNLVYGHLNMLGGIIGEDVERSHIRGNTIFSPGSESCIIIGQAYQNIIDSNQLFTAGTAIYIDATSDSNVIEDQLFGDSVAIPVLDLGVKTRRFRRSWAKTDVVTLGTGTTESVDIPVPAGVFIDAPSAAQANFEGFPGLPAQGIYNFSLSSAVSLNFTVRRLDGAALPGGGARYTVSALE